MGAIRLVRHGQASWEADDYDQLSELGTRQASWLGQSWEAEGFVPSWSVAGGLRRHAQTAVAAIDAIDGDLVVVARDGVKLNLVEDAELASGERPELGVETDDLDAVYADVAARRPDLLHPNLDRPTLREWGAREVALLDVTTVCVVLREWPSPESAVSGR